MAVAPKKRWYKSTWFKVALLAGIAGAVTAGVMASRDGGGTATSTPTIIISPGSPTIGGPQ